MFKMYTMMILEALIAALVQSFILWFLWSNIIIIELTMLPAISFACMLAIIIFTRILTYTKNEDLNRVSIMNIEQYLKVINLFAQFVMAPSIAKAIETKVPEAIDNTDETE